MEIFFENPGLSQIGLKILKDLDIKSLASCRQVCKSMNIEIEYLASNISFEDLEQLLEKYTVARSMTLEDHNVWHKFLVSIFDQSQIGRSKSNPFVKLYLKHFFMKNTHNAMKLRRSPFYEFVYNGNVKMVLFNLHHNNFHGKNYMAVHSSLQDLQSAISFAIQNDQLEMVKPLHQITSTMDIMNSKGNSPIHQAAKEGRLEIVKFLATTKSDPHILNLFGKSPMDLAIENDHLDIVTYLNEFPCLNKKKKHKSLKAVVPNHPWFRRYPSSAFILPKIITQYQRAQSRILSVTSQILGE